MSENFVQNPQSFDGAGLTKKVTRGAVWNVGARVFVRSVGLLNTLILARMLVPNDFGLVAICVVIMQLLQNITDIGVSRTVVKLQNATKAQYDTLFTISLLRGLLLTLVMVAVAFGAGGFFGDQRAGPVLLALSVAPLLHALANPRFAEFERDLKFSRLFWIAVVDKAVGVSVSVGVAIALQSYWAIIAGLLAGRIVQTLVTWMVRPYRPRLCLAAVYEVGGFTGWMFALSIAAALNNKLDTLFLGRFTSAADVGAFHVGGSVAALPSGELAIPIVNAVYPGLATLQSDATAMRSAYLRAAEALGFFVLPIALCFAFTAEDIVLLLLGEGWDSAALMLKYCTPPAGLAAVLYATHSYAFAMGHVRLVFWREVLLFCLRMPLFVAAAYFFGLEGAAAASGGGLLIGVTLNAILYKRLSGAAALEPFWRARRSLCGVLAIAGFFFIAPLSMFDSAPVIVRLFIDFAAGGSVYLASVLTLWRLEGRPDGVEKTAVNQLTVLIRSIWASHLKIN